MVTLHLFILTTKNIYDKQKLYITSTMYIRASNLNNYEFDVKVDELIIDLRVNRNSYNVDSNTIMKINSILYNNSSLIKKLSITIPGIKHITKLISNENSTFDLILKMTQLEVLRFNVIEFGRNISQLLNEPVDDTINQIVISLDYTKLEKLKVLQIIDERILSSWVEHVELIRDNVYNFPNLPKDLEVFRTNYLINIDTKNLVPKTLPNELKELTIGFVMPHYFDYISLSTNLAKFFGRFKSLMRTGLFIPLRFEPDIHFGSDHDVFFTLMFKEIEALGIHEFVTNDIYLLNQTYDYYINKGIKHLLLYPLRNSYLNEIDKLFNYDKHKLLNVLNDVDEKIDFKLTLFNTRVLHDYKMDDKVTFINPKMSHKI